MAMASVSNSPLFAARELVNRPENVSKDIHKATKTASYLS